MLKLGGEAALIMHRPTERPIHLEARKCSFHNDAMLYRGFPSKLHHEVPHWVETGALFHIRVAVDREKERNPLTDTPFAQALLDSARFYEIKRRWYITLFLLMPDHRHFDHRLRDDERGEQLSAKMNYIRHNPVAAGLCTRAEDWPWIIERSACGGSSSPLLDVKTWRRSRINYASPDGAADPPC
jgi:hypothetical protein